MCAGCSASVPAGAVSQRNALKNQIDQGRHQTAGSGELLCRVRLQGGRENVSKCSTAG